MYTDEIFIMDDFQTKKMWEGKYFQKLSETLFSIPRILFEIICINETFTLGGARTLNTANLESFPI